MKWRLFDSGIKSAAANMELDAKLLASLESDPQALLHLYEWKSSAATSGCFVNPADFLDLEAAKRWGVDLAKRPTGGGILFHTCDLAFSVLVPAFHPRFSREPLDNYHFVNQIVGEAIHRFCGKRPDLLPRESDPISVDCKRFCMAKPTKYDLMIQGKKVGGAAQRKTRYGYLHQASISLVRPQQEFLNEILLDKQVVGETMRQTTFSLLGEESFCPHLEEARRELRSYLRDAFSIG